MVNASLSVYEEMLEEAYKNGLIVKEVELQSNALGLIRDNKIAINKMIDSQREKNCVLAEELGHYYTSVGDILDLNNISNNQQEIKARGVAYNKLIPLKKIANVYFSELPKNIYELSELLEVTESFLKEALKYYESKYGKYTIMGEYLITFSPFHVYKKENVYHNL